MSRKSRQPQLKARMQALLHHGPGDGHGPECTGRGYFISHYAWSTPDVEAMKRQIDSLVAEFHPAVRKMIRVRFFPEYIEDGWEKYEASKWIVSASLEITVDEHYAMEHYLEEPGAAASYPADINRLDDYLATLTLHPEVLRRENPKYVFPFQIGTRVIVGGYEERGPGEIVGPYPGQKKLFLVRLPDGEVVAGHVNSMKRLKRKGV